MPVAIAITIGFAEIVLDFTLLRWFHCSKMKIHGDMGELASNVLGLNPTFLGTLEVR